MTPYRTPAGGRVDRSTTWTFALDGVDYTGHPGDTLASALLANGVRTVGHSIAQHRPRGIYTAGSHEPGGLVRIDSGLAPKPMQHATEVELYDGLSARSLAGKGVVSDVLDEPHADAAPGPRHDKAYLHCDVLIVGAGPAGLAAARSVGLSGARVVVLDEQPEFGGDLLGSRALLDDAPAMSWVDRVVDELAGMAEVRLFSRTTAVGYYDHNYVLAVQRRTEHLGDAAPRHRSQQRLWHIRAHHVVLATGAHERPIVFTDNDRPGVMLASAARTYVNRFGVLPGRRATVFTNGDSGYASALDLLDGGVQVGAIVDVRPEPALRGEPTNATWPALLRWRGVEVLRGRVITGTHASSDADTDGQLSAVRVAHPDGDRDRVLACDLLAVSGGWNPAVQLFSQAQGQLRYDGQLATFVPTSSVQDARPVGAVRGVDGTADAIADGTHAGSAVATRLGFGTSSPSRLPTEQHRPTEPLTSYWAVPAREPDETTRQFVDLERDATVHDVTRAIGTGMRSIEHIKRFTTIGTGSDQGKLTGVVSVGVISELLGRSPGETGTTTYRPPYIPVGIDVFAGRDRGPLADPVRVTPMHDWHIEHGAVFEDVGQWKRPWYYPRPAENMHAAVLRECAAARESVAVMDVSTLGKIDIQGPDTAEFLDRVYTNTMSTLKVGRCRYGVMCSADGMVFDDGVVARLGDDHVVTTTTTGNAAAVLDWLEEWLQTEWPHLRVWATSVTDHWAAVAIVGPRAREVLAGLAPDLALDAESFPFLGLAETTVELDGTRVEARVFRVSFSGELAFEVNVPAWYGLELWKTVLAAGVPYGITPYGTETMHVLRAEKGLVIVGQETDGTVTPHDLGMSWAVSKKKDDFVGLRSLSRSDTAREDRARLVGLLPEDPAEVLPEGAQLVAEPGEPPLSILGRVTSSYPSAALDRSFALALVADGSRRMGDRLFTSLADRTVPVTVTEPVFYDTEGKRRDG